jgi:hypothetical protein
MDRYRLAPLALRVRAKEDRCSKYLLKGRPKTAALSSSLLHPEDVEHFSRAAKPNYSTLLPDGERSQKDRDEPVLTPRQSVRRVPGYLKKKSTRSSAREGVVPAADALRAIRNNTNGREENPTF